MTTNFGATRDGTSEIQLKTIGRVTGRQVSIPVWFVRHGAKIYLVPVTGSDSQWFRNARVNPTIGLPAGDSQQAAVGTAIDDVEQVRGIVEEFRNKYGADDVAAHYPRPNAVEATFG